MADNNQGFYGQHRPPDLTSPYLRQRFMIDQPVKRISTATLMQVQKVSVSGQVGPVGVLTATPMVNMLDGANNISKHGPVNNILYSRMQGGSKAVILDPKPGDIGLVVMCDRDTTAVRKNKKQSNPGSKRRFDMADGVYVMTVLGSTPTSYVEFKDDGTIVMSPDSGTTTVQVKAGEVLVDVSGERVRVVPGRVELGTGALSPVLTVAGPSSQVFAAI